jgi:PAS domain S-box-containing protein
LGADMRDNRLEYARAQGVREEVAQQALETVAEGGPLVGVLEFLCRTMEDESRDRVIACIHPLDEDAAMFRDTAAPSLDQSYAEAVNGMLVSSMTGPCCYAVATRQTIVVPEVAADSRFSGFRAFADPLGVRSCWSTPIFSNEGRMLGTFAHYYFEPRDPSPRDERMVGLLTRAAAVAIERSRAEAALRELNATLEHRVAAQARERDRIWKVSHDLMLVQGSDGKVLNVNPAWTATLGWAEADFLGRTLEWVLHPEDLERTRAEFDRTSAGGEARVFENRYRHKDGSIRWLSWRVVHDQGGLIYAVARDVTELKRRGRVARNASRTHARESTDDIVDHGGHDCARNHPAAIGGCHQR